MKKVISLAIVVFSLIFATCYAETPFYDDSLEISCENGKILVEGSFESQETTGKNYWVMLATYSDEGELIKLDYSDGKPVVEGTNTFSLTADITDSVQNTKAFVWTDGIMPVCKTAKKTIYSLKVLAIGNSFSEDATKWLYNIADDYGVDNIVIGNGYIGGCSLQTHANNATNNKNSYTYYKNTTGTWTSQSSKSIKYMLSDESWDLITIQQVSGSSGMPDTYEPYLTTLIEYINKNKTNPNAKIAWHTTWAYQQSSTHSDFAKYNKDQLTMYNAIISTKNSKVLTKAEIAYEIPVGTAIQNVRTSFIGDKLTRDGYHLSNNLGRYIAGMTWFHKIMGLSIDDIDYVPSSADITPSHLKVIKECVKNAVLYPDTITKSEYATLEDAYEEIEINLDDYVLIDWDPLGSSYYNSSVSSLRCTKENTQASNLKYFISSKIFTKEDLPNGTVIEIDEGYQYRPEGWTSLDSKTGSRPGNVTIKRIIVDDSWWGNFNYRAFNVAVVGATTDISAKAAEVAGYFRIYVPKE